MSPFINYLHQYMSKFAYTCRALIFKRKKTPKIHAQTHHLFTEDHLHYQLKHEELPLPKGASFTMITCPAQQLSFAETPITFAQYEALLTHSLSDYHHYPVYAVSWYEAVHFCNLLSEQMGYSPFYIFEGDQLIAFNQNMEGFRLPTELEWQYLATAGKTELFDEEQISRAVWYEGNTSDIKPVKEKEPNSWGVYDVYGLVWEWCHNDYFIPREEKINSMSRAMRGGSWAEVLSMCNSQSRKYNKPNHRSKEVGFRVVRSCHFNTVI